MRVLRALIAAAEIAAALEGGKCFPSSSRPCLPLSANSSAPDEARMSECRFGQSAVRNVSLS